MTTPSSDLNIDVLDIISISDHPEFRGEVMALNQVSFPPESFRCQVTIPEHLPFSLQSAEWAVRENASIIGSVHMLVSSELAILFHFAVSRDCRGRGIGGKILEWMNRTFAEKTLFFCVETPLGEAPNLTQRLALIRLYERSGFQFAGIGMMYQGRRYSFMCRSTADDDEIAKIYAILKQVAESRVYEMTVFDEPVFIRNRKPIQ